MTEKKELHHQLPPQPSFVESSGSARLPNVTLTLDCWVRGDDINHIFLVSISSTKTVASLKEAIKNKNQADLHDIDAHTLILYSTPAPDDDDALEKHLKSWTSDGKPCLRARRRLCDLNLSSSIVVVDAPGLGPAQHSTTTRRSAVVLDMAFNCWVRGYDANCIFPVEISGTKTIAALKKAIKKEKSVEFRDVDADSLALYKVSVPFDDRLPQVLCDLSIDQEHPLLPYLKLADISADHDEDNLHIVVEAPLSTRLRARPEPSMNSLSLHGVANQRVRWLQTNQPVPPSDGGRADKFALRQDNPDNAIYCGRPYTTSPTIPVTLLHPAFCHFHDDCETHKTTPADNAFAQSLSEAMSGFYPSESSRAERIRDLFADQGLHFIPSDTPNKYKTDGDMSVNGNRYALLEIKNEIGYSGAEPFNQACLYYMDVARGAAVAMEGECIPCVIVLLFGPYLAFAGAAWNLRPVVQIFSILPMHCHATDTYMRIKAARHLGALKKVILALEKVYTNIAALRAPLSPPRSQVFPYPTQFTPLRGGARHTDFQYTAQPFQDKLLFYGTIPAEMHDICIKFVRRYSKEAHELCASWGCAPTLLGFEAMPAGWFMVVMDKLSPKEYSEIRIMQGVQPPTSRQMLRIREMLRNLHQHGWVHGDVRDANIMLSRTDLKTVMFVDFDWAGKIEQVRYPMNVNKGPGLWRPERVVDGELILADDDLAMWKEIEDRIRAPLARLSDDELDQ